MIVWRESEDMGPLGVPSGSTLRIDALAKEVSEYFERGATVRPGDVVFDVGANIGAFAVEAARRASGAIQLHAFEPAPPIFPALCANASQHPSLRRSLCRLSPVALSDGTRGTLTELSYFSRFPTDSTCDMRTKRRDFERFFEQRGRRVEGALDSWVGGRLAGLARRGVASLPKGHVGRWVSDRVTGRTTYTCPSTTLSKVISDRQVPRIDLLKIDVEGAELDVLRGVSADHWGRVRQLVLEGHDQAGRLEAVASVIRDAGFGHYTFGKPAAAEESGLDTFLVYARRDADRTTH